MRKMEVFVKGKLFYSTYITPDTMPGAMLPNLLGDGRTLLLQGPLVGWYEPVTTEDDVTISYSGS